MSVETSHSIEKEYFDCSEGILSEIVVRARVNLNYCT